LGGPPPNPAIASLSVPGGQPGDPIIIYGSGFGASAGEVHIVLGAAPWLTAAVSAGAIPAALGSQDQLLNVSVWQGSQIFVTLPPLSGFLAANGALYVKRKSDGVASNLVGFQFTPAVQAREIRSLAPNGITSPYNPPILGDAVMSAAGTLVFWNNPPAPDVYVSRGNGNWFASVGGNDQFFLNTRLQNGWVVSGAPTVYVPFPSNQSGGAYLVDSRVGTNSPFTNVGYWLNPLFQPGSNGDLAYGVVIPIQGPSGVPDGIACHDSATDGCKPGQ